MKNLMSSKIIIENKTKENVAKLVEPKKRKEKEGEEKESTSCKSFR